MIRRTALLALFLVLLAGPAAAGYRDVLVSLTLPPDGIVLGDPIPLCVTTTEGPLYYELRVYDAGLQLVHTWSRGWIRSSREDCFDIATYASDTPGTWHVSVFIWGGSTFDGDGITFPVVEARR